MKISSSNVLTESTIAVNSDDSGQDIDNIKGYDFSENYAGAGIDATMEFEFTLAETTSISYVSIAGHTLIGTVEIFFDDVSVYSYTLGTRQSVLTFYFNQTDVDVIKLVFNKQGSDSTVMIVTHVAAGATFDVPNSGEQAGYKRVWLTPSKKQQVIVNGAAAPISILNRSISTQAVLSIPNMPTTIARNEFRDLGDYMITTAFFILEDEETPDSSYMCFNTKLNPPKAHSKTRNLQSVSFSYSAYTGV